MSLAADKKRWDDLHAALAKATEAKDAFDRQLHAHYGRYEDQWLTKTQRAKLEALRAKEDKIGEKIYELVERISPRRWDYGVASWWVRRELTWEDAIRPKSEPLSIVVPGSWGSPDGTVKERTAMSRRTARNTPESAGSQYATDQIASEHFAAWVRDQMLEASKADPSEQLPLETKADARVIAGNMLKQLEWDTKRELRGQELTNLIGSGARPGDSEPRPSDVAGFYDGFRKACDNSRDWLADELLTINIKTRAVAASAYKQNDIRSTLTHAVDVTTYEPLCHRVKPKNILDDSYAVDDEDAPATCPICAKRDPRFN